jgi:hypothetical protein
LAAEAAALGKSRPTGLEGASAYAKAAQQLLQRVAEREDRLYLDSVKAMANADGATLALAFGAKQAQKPWQIVGEDTTYAPDRGFGWLPAQDTSDPTPEELYYGMAARFPDGSEREVKGRQHGPLMWPYRELAPEPLRNALYCGAPRRFQIDLPDRLYEVRVVTTNPSWTKRNYLVSGMVWCNGEAALLDTVLDKGSLSCGTFTTRAPNGRIELTFGGPTGWAVVAVIVRTAEKPVPDHVADGSLREWQVSPRCANPVWHPIRQVRFSPEADLAEPRTTGWSSLKAPPGRLGLIDLGTNREAGVGDIVYAVTTIPSDRERTMRLHLGSSSSALAWLNGQEVACLPNIKGIQRDEFMGEVKLKPGPNVLVLKLMRFWERRWLFYASVTE